MIISFIAYACFAPFCVWKWHKNNIRKMFAWLATIRKASENFVCDFSSSMNFVPSFFMFWALNSFADNVVLMECATCNIIRCFDVKKWMRKKANTFDSFCAIFARMRAQTANEYFGKNNKYNGAWPETAKREYWSLRAEKTFEITTAKDQHTHTHTRKFVWKFVKEIKNKSENQLQFFGCDENDISSSYFISLFILGRQHENEKLWCFLLFQDFSI